MCRPLPHATSKTRALGVSKWLHRSTQALGASVAWGASNEERWRVVIEEAKKRLKCDFYSGNSSPIIA